MVGVLFVGAGLCAGPLVRGLWARGGAEAAPYFLSSMAFRINPPITATGMETAKETGSKKELTAPASMVRNTANGITILPPIGAGHPVQAGRRGRRPYSVSAINSEIL